MMVLKAAGCWRPAIAYLRSRRGVISCWTNDVRYGTV